MDQVASKIVAKMMTANLISKNDAEEYIYGVQILLEKIISYATILLLALIWILPTVCSECSRTAVLTAASIACQ